jgi:hypothetical protein
MGNGMGIEWIAVGIVMAGGAVFVGFPVGVGVGYAWRARISRMRRLQATEEQRRTKIDRELARLDAMRAEHPDGNPPEEAVSADANSSGSTIAEAIDVGKEKVRRVRRARRKVIRSSTEVAKRTARDGTARKAPRKVKLKVITGDVVQEPEQDRGQAH